MNICQTLRCEPSYSIFLFPIVNTHCHADHITSTGLMKKRLVGLKSAISKFSGASADIFLSEGDKITFGKHVRRTCYLFQCVMSIHATVILKRLTVFMLRCIMYVLQYRIVGLFSILYFDLTLLQLKIMYCMWTHPFILKTCIIYSYLKKWNLVKIAWKNNFHMPWVELCLFSAVESDSERDAGTHWWVCGAGVRGSEHGFYWGHSAHQRLWQDRLPAG